MIKEAGFVRAAAGKVQGGMGEASRRHPRANLGIVGICDDPRRSNLLRRCAGSGLEKSAQASGIGIAQFSGNRVDAIVAVAELTDGSRGQGVRARATKAAISTQAT